MNRKILYSDSVGFAQFVDISFEMERINERVSLSPVLPATGVQFRTSPLNIFNDWHCSPKNNVQWVIVTQGLMKVSVRGGDSVTFAPGDMFLSMDIDTGIPEKNGHTSESLGDKPLETLFVKVPYEEAAQILDKALGK